VKRRTTKFDVESGFPVHRVIRRRDLLPAGSEALHSPEGGSKAPTGMLAASASAMALRGVLIAASAPVKNGPPRAAKGAESSDLSAKKSRDRKFSQAISLRITAASPPSQSLC
jgi:hypothetical protein